MERQFLRQDAFSRVIRIAIKPAHRRSFANRYIQYTIFSLHIYEGSSSTPWFGGFIDRQPSWNDLNTVVAVNIGIHSYSVPQTSKEEPLGQASVGVRA